MTLNPITAGLLLANTVLGACLAALALAPAAPPASPSSGQPAAALAPMAAPAAPAPVPAALLASAWQQPLFSPGRQPDAGPPSAAAPAGLAGISLSGVVLAATSQWALLRLPGQALLKLRPGEALPNGWVLTALASTSATFTHQGHTQTLNIPVLRLPAPALPAHPKHLDVHTP